MAGICCTARTFIDIRAGNAVPGKARFAGAGVAAGGVCAIRIGTAVIGGWARALVDVSAGGAVAGVTHIARARVATNGVGTGCVIIASVRSQRTFIQIDTRRAVPREAIITCARKAPGSVRTRGICVAGVGQTLIDVFACESIAFKARLTDTFKDILSRFRTGCVRVTSRTWGVDAARSESITVFIRVITVGQWSAHPLKTGDIRAWTCVCA